MYCECVLLVYYEAVHPHLKKPPYTSSGLKDFGAFQERKKSLMLLKRCAAGTLSHTGRNRVDSIHISISQKVGIELKIDLFSAVWGIETIKFLGCKKEFCFAQNKF